MATTHRPVIARPGRQRGLSLIEGLAVLCVLSIATGSALGPLRDMLQREHLRGAAAELETDIQLARSEAVMRNQPVRLTLNAGGVGAGSCYLVHTGPAEACRCEPGQVPRCDGPARVFRSVSLPAGGPVQLRSAVRSIVFDGTLGTSTPAATLRLQAPDGTRLHHVVNVLGRTRSCIGAGALAGLPRC